MEIKVGIQYVEKDKFTVDFQSTDKKIFVDKKEENYTPQGPSPLELFLGALGSCIGVYSKNYLKSRLIPFNKLNVNVKSIFSVDRPPMLKDIKVFIDTDAELKDKKEDFLRYVKNCPIHNTIIHTDKIDVEVNNE